MGWWFSMVMAGLVLGQPAGVMPGPAGVQAPPQGWVGAGAYMDMHVVIPEHPSETMRYAAETFQRYWQLCSGYQIKVSPYNEGLINVWLGPETLTEDLLNPDELEGLGEDGCIIRTMTPRKREMKQGAMKQLIITGATDRGTLNGVFEFFQRVINKQWLAPDLCNTARLRYVLPEMDYRIVPAFSYREVGYFGFWTPDALEYRRAHKFPDVFQPGPCAVHTFYALLPPTQFFEAHPEFYAEIDGKRTAFLGDWKDPESLRRAPDPPAQLCCGNPAVAEAITSAIVNGINAHPETKLWSVSQMDGLRPCQCALCREIDAREESPAGSLLTLVNRVAERIDGLFPGKGYVVHTLACQYSRKPPKQLRPRENVLIQLSDLECDFARPLDDPRSPVNAAFARDLRGWSRLTDKLYVWDYASSLCSCLQPFPNFQVIQPNLQFFDQNGVKGVFEATWGAPGGKLAEFDALRCFLLSKCIWDQDAPMDELQAGFLQVYYGPAAQPIQEYLQLLTQKVRAPDAYLGCGEPLSWMDYATVVRAEELFQQALGLNLNEDQKQRVATAHLPVIYAALLCPPRIQQEKDKLIFDRPPCMPLEQLVEELRSRGENTNETAAWHPIRDLTEACNGVTPPRHEEHPLTVLENDRSLLWIVPDLHGAILRWRDKALGVELLRGFERYGAGPGVWEAWTGDAGGNPGPVAEPYVLKEQTADRAVLESTLANGLVLTRTVTLLSGEDGLSVSLTVSNPTAQAVASSLRSRPEFYSQVPKEPELWGFQNGAWARLEYKEAYAGSAWNALRCPAGALAKWAFYVPEKNLSLLNTFTSAETGELKAYYNTLPSRQQMNLELALPGTPIAPGETRSMSATYAVSGKAPKDL